jgi:hypothetical protein
LFSTTHRVFKHNRNIGMKQIKEGKVIDADVVMARLGDEYGFPN